MLNNDDVDIDMFEGELTEEDIPFLTKCLVRDMFDEEYDKEAALYADSSCFLP